MECRFRIGDCVIVTSDIFNNSDLPIGEVFKINHIIVSGHDKVGYWVYRNHPFENGISQYSVELAEDYILKELWKDDLK